MKKDNKPKIKVSKNIWGNYKCRIGKGHAVHVFDWDRDAQLWLDEEFVTGKYELSKHSELQPRPVEL